LAKEGLRTLAITQKIMTENEFIIWEEKMRKAGKDYKRREEKETQCIEDLEKNMQFLGITGVEDL